MNYGAMYKIEEQLNQRGYTLGDKEELIEKLHSSLNMCHIYRVITDNEWRKALQRLDKMVIKNVKPMRSEQDE